MRGVHWQQSTPVCHSDSTSKQCFSKQGELREVTGASCQLLSHVHFTQAVCEEAPEAKVYGSRTKGKQRFLAGVVTPAQPHYLYGLLDANQDPHLGMAPPILGIAASAGGYQVMASIRHTDRDMALV